MVTRAWPLNSIDESDPVPGLDVTMAERVFESLYDQKIQRRAWGPSQYRLKGRLIQMNDMHAAMEKIPNRREEFVVQKILEFIFDRRRVFRQLRTDLK